MKRLLTTTGVLAAMGAMTACGSDPDYANEPRPPTPINVSAAISDDRITVSPGASARDRSSC